MAIIINKLSNNRHFIYVYIYCTLYLLYILYIIFIIYIVHYIYYIYCTLYIVYG